jgi:acyl dehydratase
VIAGPTTPKVFSKEDQEGFAIFSGDINPLHLDSLSARRTQLGTCAVHGIHLVLWSLEQLADGVLGKPATGLRVRFLAPVAVGTSCELRRIQRSGSLLRFEVWSEGVAATLGELCFDNDKDPSQAQPRSEMGRSPSSINLRSPRLVELENFAAHSGHFVAPVTAEMAVDMFPRVCAAIGPHRVTGLASLSYLVGMVCPGLHSIFGSLDVAFLDGLCGTIFYDADAVDTRFRRIVQRISCGSLVGAVEAYFRVPPVEQPRIADLSGLVAKSEFAHVRALVVGGSRGLGALTAKILMAGGAEVVATYATGQAEAEALVAEAKENGRSLSVMHLDVIERVENQLANIRVKPIALYYFATPRIMRGASTVVDRGKFDKFNEFYCLGFSRVVGCLADSLRMIFYPSTIFLDKIPPDMKEYCMSKAAGEILCDALARANQKLNICKPRLPRMLTDQTAGVTPSRFEDGVGIILPLIRKLHGAPRRSDPSWAPRGKLDRSE